MSPQVAARSPRPLPQACASGRHVGRSQRRASPAALQLTTCQGDSCGREAEGALEPQALEAPGVRAKTSTLQAAMRGDMSPGPFTRGAGRTLRDSSWTLAESSGRLPEGRLPDRRPRTHAAGCAPLLARPPRLLHGTGQQGPQGRSPRARARAVCPDVTAPGSLWGCGPCCHPMAPSLCGIGVPMPRPAVPAARGPGPAS